MTNIQAELIKALRDCAATWNTIDDCDVEECPFTSYGSMCIDTMLEAAADALEAANEMIADCTAAIDALDDSNDAYIKENERLKKRIAELEKYCRECEEIACHYM